MTELLKQPQYSPLAIWEMYVTLYAATEGAFDDVPLEKIKIAEQSLLREIKSKQTKLIEALNTGDKPTDAQNQTVLKIAKTIAGSYKEAPKKAKTEETEEK